MKTSSLWKSLSMVAALSVFGASGCSGAPSDAPNAGGDTADDDALAAATIDGWRGPSASDAEAALSAHANVDPNHQVPRDLLGKALAFHDLNRDRLSNRTYVTVVDFGRHSGKRRFFIVDLDTGSVETHVVAHGSGSDPRDTGFAKRFSNVEGSDMSSLGYYVTGETYDGKHGYSLRLDGVSSSNSHVRSREIVVHGADYVEPGRSPQGRSSGCLALPQNEVDGVVRKLRGGSVIYANLSSG